MKNWRLYLSGCILVFGMFLAGLAVCGASYRLTYYLVSREEIPPLEALVPSPAPTSVAQPAAPQVTSVAPAAGQVCVGPAILEAQVEGRNGVIKIDAGESRAWYPPGSCFGEPYFHGDQGFLNNRFPTHVEEYRAKLSALGGDTAVLVQEVVGDNLEPYQSVLQQQGQAPTQVPPVSSAEQPAPGDYACNWPTDMDGYQASPVGLLDSELWVLAETWGPDGANQGYVVLLPPGGVMWLQNHFGGTCWWEPPGMDLTAEAELHQANIKARDGRDPTIIWLPDEGFPLLGCLQTLPVEGNIRHCDVVGDFPAFDAPAEEPFPGYFPGGTLAGTDGVGGTCEGLTASGPAIVEKSVGGVPTVVRVDSGATYDYTGGGCFAFDSQAALEARWEDHLAAFLVKYSNGNSLVVSE